MLEKFGWSKGSGLGKNKQGISENIRVEHKVQPTGNSLILFSTYHTSSLKYNMKLINLVINHELLFTTIQILNLVFLNTVANIFLSYYSYY